MTPAPAVRFADCRNRTIDVERHIDVQEGNRGTMKTKLALAMTVLAVLAAGCGAATNVYESATNDDVETYRQSLAASNPAVQAGVDEVYCEKVREGMNALGEPRGVARQEVERWFIDTAIAQGASSAQLDEIRGAIDYAIQQGNC